MVSRTLQMCVVIDLFFLAEPAVRFGHMQYELDHESSQGGAPSVIFMYKLVSGACSKSLGMNVAQMCGLPSDLIQRAQHFADEFAASVATARHSVQALETTHARYQRILDRCKSLAAEGRIDELKAQLSKLVIT